MGGSGSGDDVIAGEKNGANDQTFIIAETHEKGGSDSFPHSGGILVLTPNNAIKRRPLNPISGVIAFGYKGAPGVRGHGSQPFIDRAAPSDGAGTGGHGVAGYGGNANLDIEKLEAPTTGQMKLPPTPGYGVLGIGGYWRGEKQNRSGDVRDNRGGAGVVGVAGGEDSPRGEPSFTEGKGAGVFGLSHVGEGVLGKGWEAGVHGVGHAGPGGIFEGTPAEGGKTPRAQVRLVPQVMRLIAETVTPTILSPDPRLVDQLPKVGQAGDFLTTIDGPGTDASAVLWFCERTVTTSCDRW